MGVNNNKTLTETAETKAKVKIFDCSPSPAKILVIQ